MVRGSKKMSSPHTCEISKPLIIHGSLGMAALESPLLGPVLQINESSNHSHSIEERVPKSWWNGAEWLGLRPHELTWCYLDFMSLGCIISNPGLNQLKELFRPNQAFHTFFFFNYIFPFLLHNRCLMGVLQVSRILWNFLHGAHLLRI